MVETGDTGLSGLYAKYEVREDGQPVEDCFVLEPETDSAARVALAAYAGHTDDEALRRDLNEWLGEMWNAEDSDEDGDST